MFSCLTATVVALLLVSHVADPVVSTPAREVRNVLGDAFGAVLGAASGVGTALSNQARKTQFSKCLQSSANQVPQGNEILVKYLFHNLRTCVDTKQSAKEASACYASVNSVPANQVFASHVISCMGLK
ncbi:uncharacterized protein LOC117653364 [Thrips palmi]|uniref:Uncharacterized protein LOC117653364 n=1 Tax=Thrips palmi TaxID=161013 RepID=A0A6P9ABW4_THRPL|nr:uncharacterized protein LOC117653364 [Thrips palmi]